MQIHRYLALFNYIVSSGCRRHDKYVVEQLAAWHDYDGYTCYLSYKDLTLTLYFHNKFSLEYHDSKTLTAFEQLVEHYDQHKQLITLD